MTLKIAIINSCLNCDNGVPLDKMICSYRCLNQMRKAFKEQCPEAKKGDFSYDASDVYVRKESK